MDNYISVKNLLKTYEGKTALNHISLSVPRNSIFGLLGPNGAGKTTFIRILNKIIAFDSGEITIDNKPLNKFKVSSIGYLPEERGLYKKMKVADQIIYFAMLKGLDKTTARKKTYQLLKKFNMLSWAGLKLQELSKGMQQKVQFLITIIHDPDLLILDEPFTGFDPINQQIIKNEILQLHKNGKTIIFSTHQMASVEELCDYIVLINNGQNILEGKISQIKQQFKQNIFQISFQSPTDLPPNQMFQILESDKLNYKIKLSPQYTSNQLLLYVAQYGNILSFNEILPSLQDIFIQVVQKTQTPQS